MPVINSIAAVKDEFAEYRKEMHQNPQTAFEEEFAAGLVAKKLEEWGIPFKSGIGITGVVATIQGQSAASGKTIGLRADMDALDVTEKTNLPYASKNEGKMHACGHDGHTATLLAAAKYLAENKNFDGTVHLIFQPAEEGAGGAMKMLEDGLFEEFPCDYVFGLHNWPGLQAGKIATRVGPLLAAADEFNIEIKARGGHAASPHHTIDPAVIAAQIVMAFQTIVSRNVDPIDTAVISVSNLNVGEGAFNIISDTAILNGTVRTFSQDTRQMIRKRMEDLVKNITAGFNADYGFEYKESFEPTINTSDGVDMAAAAANDIVGAENVDLECPARMGSEDFGAFLQHNPGAFIFVGQGTEDPESPHNQGLHNPHYDFNDEIIPIGASLFAKIVERYMPLGKE